MSCPYGLVFSDRYRSDGKKRHQSIPKLHTSQPRVTGTRSCQSSPRSAGSGHTACENRVATFPTAVIFPFAIVDRYLTTMDRSSAINCTVTNLSWPWSIVCLNRQADSGEAGNPSVSGEARSLEESATNCTDYTKALLALHGAVKLSTQLGTGLPACK